MTTTITVTPSCYTTEPTDDGNGNLVPLTSVCAAVVGRKRRRRRGIDWEREQLPRVTTPDGAVLDYSQIRATKVSHLPKMFISKVGNFISP